MLVAVVLTIVGATCVSWCLLRTPLLAPAPSAGGSTTVVVPARNEAANLPGLLQSLGPPDAVLEVIVVDDGSLDATAAVAARHGARVVEPGVPPDGWLGKPWACAAGARAATHRRLVFLDADVRLARGGLAAVLGAHGRHGGLVSVQPAHHAGAPAEELSAPFNVCAVAGAGGGRPGHARVAFGPCVVVDRDVYDHLGGHGAVAGSVIEDVDLARRARSVGVPVSTWRGGDLVTFRMYPQGWRSLRDGWTKNIARGAGAAPRWALVGTVAWIAGLGAIAMELAGGVVGWVGGGAAPWLAAVVYAIAAAQCAWAFRRVGRFRTVTAVAYPVTLLVFVGVFARSLLAVALRRPVRWRERDVRHTGTRGDEVSSR